ncbi:hypothetical protein [Veronia nyctiphanis]|uniref:hypothetical protein n=1 Tax=Veronia nyctiphanis TaxID=1278244 RepID=UPI00100B4EDC|nr:hypothetical protein [Veronia nyctiphanis]
MPVQFSFGIYGQPLQSQKLGVQVVNTEMVLFEWLHKADTEVFKQVLPAIKKLLPSPENMDALTSLFDAADEEEKT